jgi:hypothetical protein
VSKSQLRKTAYNYIKGQLSKLHGRHYDGDPAIIVTLDELMLLKEGLTDPSAELVASLKQLFQGISTEAEIDARLVVPFRQRRQGKIYKIEGRSHR